MKPKAACLVAAIATITLVSANSLGGVAQQVWNPQVARAAKVTVNLLKESPIAPMRLVRNPQRSPEPGQPANLQP
jgi:hypothetical protein